MAIKKQLAIFLENRPGGIARVLDAFKEASVNILGITVSDTVDHAVVRLIVDDEPKAIDVLESGNVLVQETEVVAASLPNRPGAFSELAKLLAERGVNIDYCYGSASSAAPERNVLYLRVSDVKAAEKALGELA